MLGYICRLRSIPMVSSMLLSHRSQAVQTSRFSPVYSHGQLYVAISQVTSSENIKIFSGQGPNGYMWTVVYKEILEM